MKNTFSKSFLKGAGFPMIAAMAASVFFSATPGLLFAGPTNENGVFVTRTDFDDPSTLFRVLVADNTDVIVMRSGSTAQGNLVVKRFLRPGGTGVNINATLDSATHAIVELCFPKTGAPSGQFSGDDVQALVDFFNAN